MDVLLNATCKEGMLQSYYFVVVNCISCYLESSEFFLCLLALHKLLGSGALQGGHHQAPAGNQVPSHVFVGPHAICGQQLRDP